MKKKVIAFIVSLAIDVLALFLLEASGSRLIEGFFYVCLCFSTVVLLILLFGHKEAKKASYEDLYRINHKRFWG